MSKSSIIGQVLAVSFKNNFDRLADTVHRMARKKGWWDKPRNDGEMVALIHSELSETLEGLRAGNPPDDKITQFSSAEAELADVIIRIMDFSRGRGWDISGALLEKIKYNDSREQMHGGKKF